MSEIKHIDDISDDELHKFLEFDYYGRVKNVRTKYDMLTDQENIKAMNVELRQVLEKISLYQSIYDFHGSDCYEDVFRDGKCAQLNQIAQGICLAIREAHLCSSQENF